MNTPELTVRKAKGKLIRAIFKLSTFVFVSGAVGYFSVLQSTSTVYSKGDVIQHWLRGNIAELGDSYLERIFTGISNKLVAIGNDVMQPQQPILQLKLVTPQEFNEKHQEKIHRKAVLANREVNLGMGLIRRALDDRYKASQGVDLLDTEKFAKGLQSLYSTVESKLPDARDTDLAKYSDVLLKEYFKIPDFDLVKEHYPEIQVFGIYIAHKETGTFAYYPAPNNALEMRLDERPWYNTSIGPNAYNNSNDRKPEQGEQVISRSDVGLTPFYGDIVSGGFTRTLWYRFGDSNYVACVDIIMQSPEQPNKGIGLAGSPFSNSSVIGKLGNSILFGLILSVLLFILGATFVSFGGPWAEAISRRYISGKPTTGPSSSGYVVLPISKEYMTYAEPTDVRHDDTISSSKSATTKGGFGVKTPHLNIEFEQQIREERSTQLAETRRLSLSQDEKLKIRGKELWAIYTRQQKSGTCRLCDQEIAHYGDEQRIGIVEIYHRMNHEPEVDFKRKRGTVVATTDFIENNMQWHALNAEEENVESGTQPLEIYPEPRVPKQFAHFRFIENLLLKYRRLNEGRYVTQDELMQISKVMLPNGVVQSVCRVSYLKKLLSDPHSQDSLELGQDIKRILVASTNEELQGFLTEYRKALTALQLSQKFLVAILRGTQLAALDNYKELNFSILTLPDGSDAVIVTEQESVSSGYLSWREADVRCYIALFKQIEDIATKLALDV